MTAYPGLAQDALIIQVKKATQCHSQLTAAHLALDGPTLALSYEELAVMALSGIAPLCIPRLLRQLAETVSHAFITALDWKQVL